jgi:cell volume regulation protein A
MIKRGDRYIVPNGSLELMLGDRLLFMQHGETVER